MTVHHVKAGSLVCAEFETETRVQIPGGGTRVWVFGPEYADAIVGVLEEWVALAAETRVPAEAGESTLLGADSSDYHVNPLEDERR